MTLAEAGQSARPRALAWVALALLLGLLSVWGLGGAPLFDVDEGAFSEATREMLASGDWGHTTLNGTDRFDKPIGVYWLQALSAAFFGINEFAVRLPSALATWGASLAMAAFVAPRLGWPAAVLAALIHVSSLGSWAMAHAATADAVLGFFLMLSALDLWRWLEQRQSAALQRLAVWVALGVLVKGPVAVLIPLASLLLAVLVERDGALLWRTLRNGRAWTWLVLIALPWYAYALWRHGHDFIAGFFLKHNLERFSSPMEGHAGSWLYFLVIAPLLWMPWSPLLLALWGHARALWQDRCLRQGLIWAAFVLVFFSLSGTKLPHYGLYAAPGMVLLLAAAAQRARAWHWVVVALLWLGWQLLMVGGPLALLHNPQWIDQPDYRALLQQTTAHIAWQGVLLAWAGVGLLALWVWRRAPAFGPQWLLAGAVGVHVLVMALVVWPWWAHTLQDPVRELGLKARAWPGVAVQWDGHWPSFAFYRRQEAPRREPQPGELALVRQSTAAAHPDWPVWAAQGSFLLVQRPVQEKQP